MKKIAAGFAVGVLVLGIFAVGKFVFNKPKKQPLPRLSIYQTTKLSDDIIAQSGEFIVKFADIADAHYDSLMQKKIEMHLALAYEQFASGKNAKSVKFSSPTPPRPLKNVCIQYALKCEGIEKAVFLDDAEQPYLSVDGKAHSIGDVVKNNIYWQALDSEVTTHILDQVNSFLRERGLYKLSQAEGKNSANVVRDTILKDRDLDTETEQMFAAWSVHQDMGKDGEAFKDLFKSQITNAAIDQYLHKTVLKLPIEINLQFPAHKPDLRWEWTPHLGKTSSPFEFIIFTDFLSEASQQLFRQLEDFYKRYPFIVIGFRPYLSKDDKLQRVAAEISLCVWSDFSDKFWKFMETSAQWSPDSMEADMYKSMEPLQIDSSKVKQCLFGRKTKEAVDYHLQYAQYLNLIASPVLFVGREVYVGALPFYKIEQILKRQLQ